MQINISGKHFSLGESLQTYVNDKLHQHIKKYFDHTISCDVHFEKINHLFFCNIIARTGVKTTIVSDSSSSDIYASYDVALSKLDKRLNKYKSRLNDYHHKIKLSESTQSHKYIIQNDLEVMTDLIEQAPSTNPVIIAEKPIEIMNLTIQQALMKMDLENLPALLFTNSDSKRLNVVYYRKDGNISWIDSK